ncbi:MAG: WD40/YVTN/BNR-like repeat-containing protein [Bacteroidales bacterium]
MSCRRPAVAGLGVLLVIAPFALGLAARAAHGPVAQAAPPPATDLYSGLRWRMIGPFRGGRVNAVSGVPGQPNTFYFGSVGGGLWKSTNAGRTWTPVFDRQGVASIGAIAVAPSRPDTVYVGTGESDMRDSIAFGDGVYKSTDAGRTWTHVGLDRTRQIGRVLVDPSNPDVVFVAALGHAYGPSPDRGVYRSRDGGATWQKVLDKGDAIGAVDLAFDPADSRTIYATLWATRRPPWYVYAPSNGPGGGIAKSTDGGTTWQMLGGGLPLEGVGRIGIVVAPSNTRRVYAIVDAKDGGLYRSDDAGATWTKASGENRIWGRGWYFGKVNVDPKNADIVYVSNTSLYRSLDAGRSWTPIKGAPGGDDYHQLWIDAAEPNRMILASDQGAIVTVDGAATWSSWYNQPTAQLYHVAADNRFPYWVTGAQQDSGPVGLPARSLHAVISMHDWTGLCAGGESGYTAPDPLRPDILFGDAVTRCNVVTSVGANVSPERGAEGAPFRHAWTQPLVFSAADPHALYFANQYLYVTKDGGDSWTRISPDLTREDPGVPPNLDAAAAADVPAAGPGAQAATGKRLGVIYTIAPSPVRDSLVWIGTDDGYIQVTSDGGKTWQNVTPSALTPWSKVTMLEASHANPNEAYAAVERHQLEDYEPYIYRTRDAGKTWQPITRGLPRGVYVQTVKEDPIKPGLLFAGTERAVFVSFDDGDSWQPLQLNLPPVSMRDLAIHGEDLIVATHGRGFWVLDGITPLRQIDASVRRADAYLFKPADTVAMPPGNENGTPLPKDEPFAENSPYGAYIDYFLRSPSPVTIEVVDGSGQVVRKISSDDPIVARDPNTLTVPAIWMPAPEPLAATAGMHRWVWDLRRATPTGGGGRGAGAGGGGRGGAPATPPGTYTVRLSAGGRTSTQTLVVKADPRSAR